MRKPRRLFVDTGYETALQRKIPRSRAVTRPSHRVTGHESESESESWTFESESETETGKNGLESGLESETGLESHNTVG